MEMAVAVKMDAAPVAAMVMVMDAMTAMVAVMDVMEMAVMISMLSHATVSLRKSEPVALSEVDSTRAGLLKTMVREH